MFSFPCRMSLTLSVTKTTNKLINFLMIKRQETGDKKVLKYRTYMLFRAGQTNFQTGLWGRNGFSKSSPWVDIGMENIGHKLLRFPCRPSLPTRSLVMLWAFSSTISDRPFFFHWIPSHKLICPHRTCSHAVVAATVNAALWQLPVAPPCINVIHNYSSLGSKPINNLHWNQICILISELPRRIIIRVPLSGQVLLFLFPSHFKHDWEVQYK